MTLENQYSHFNIDNDKSYDLPQYTGAEEFLKSRRYHRTKLWAIGFDMLNMFFRHEISFFEWVSFSYSGMSVQPGLSFAL